MKNQNFEYDEIHVIVWANTEFDQVRMDHLEAVRLAVGEKRREIVKKHKRGPMRAMALSTFNKVREAFEEKTLEDLMKAGTE